MSLEVLRLLPYFSCTTHYTILLIKITMGKISLLLISVLFIKGTIEAQIQKPIYSIVIKGGRVIDPKNNINELMDVAIQNGKIALVAKNIDTSKAVQVINAKGLYVTPGLIDIHTHNTSSKSPAFSPH